MEQNSRSLVDCSVCLHTFVDAVILTTCGHSFCDRCVRGITKCPQCRRVFNQTHIKPNYVLRDLLTIAGRGALGVGVNVTAPACPSLQVPETNDGHLAKAYCGLGVPPMLASQLEKEDSSIATRIYVLDNSASMNAGDGHLFDDPGGPKGSTSWRATRWEEVCGMALKHAAWNASLGVSCEFNILNHIAGFPVYVDPNGNVEHKLQTLRTQLQQIYPCGGTPLTECIQSICNRWRGLSLRPGQRIFVIIVTDGEPNGPASYFSSALKQFSRDLPVNFVVRLCTDDDHIGNFYRKLDARDELSLDVVDDILNESKDVYLKNPWLCYSFVLHTVREAGTLLKHFDWIDERQLLPYEASLCARLLLSGSEFVGDAESFLKIAKHDIAQSPRIFSHLTGTYQPPIDFNKLCTVLLPSKFTTVGTALQALGLGAVAEWWFEGKWPGWALSADGGLPHVTVPAALAFRQGDCLEYLSETRNQWFPCVVTQVDGVSGAVMLDLKPSVWITVEKQKVCLRRRGDKAPTTTKNYSLEYHSQRIGAWLPCNIIERDAESGAVMLDVKRGSWLAASQQSQLLRPFVAQSLQFSVGDKVVYLSATTGDWLFTTVAAVSGTSVAVALKPDVFLTTDVQATRLRPVEKSTTIELNFTNNEHTNMAG